MEIAKILRHTLGELAYNRALEGSINLHKDLEFLITSMTKRCHQALDTLDRYRQGLGRHVKAVTEEILDAEYKEVETKALENRTAENRGPDNEVPQLAPPLVPPAAPDAKGDAEKSAAVKDKDDGRHA